MTQRCACAKDARDYGGCRAACSGAPAVQWRSYGLTGGPQGTERLLKTRGKRCEELHQAHSDIKDQVNPRIQCLCSDLDPLIQMTKIEELRSPSPVSRRRSIPPPPSPVGLSTPTSEGSDGSDVHRKKPPASAAKLRQLAKEDSPEVLRKMIVTAAQSGARQ